MLTKGIYFQFLDEEKGEPQSYKIQNKISLSAFRIFFPYFQLTVSFPFYEGFFIIYSHMVLFALFLFLVFFFFFFFFHVHSIADF